MLTLELGCIAMPGSTSDLSDRAVFPEVCGPPRLTFGTLRRPRIRSKLCPSGFNPDDPLTALRNLLARRVAFLCCVIALAGQYFSVEQPGSSVMFYMHCFRVLLGLGAVITRLACCNFGSAFNKPMQWLRNKPWLLSLSGACACPYKGRRLVVQGSFTRATLALFEARCRPSSLVVYGRSPRPGEPLARFSGSYPIPLMDRMAAGSLQHKDGVQQSMPLSVRLSSLEEVDHELALELPPGFDEISADSREFFDDPEWIGELADSLTFKELLRYRFTRPGHINVLETRTFQILAQMVCQAPSKLPRVGAHGLARAARCFEQRSFFESCPFQASSSQWRRSLPPELLSWRRDGCGCCCCWEATLNHTLALFTPVCLGALST